MIGKDSKRLSLWDQFKRVGLILSCTATAAFASLPLMTGWAGIGTMPVPASLVTLAIMLALLFGSLLVMYRVIFHPFDFFHGHEKNGPEPNIGTTLFSAALKDVAEGIDKIGKPH